MIKLANGLQPATVVWEYTGKPNRIALAAFVKRLKAIPKDVLAARYYAEAVEFDRQHVVAKSFLGQILRGGLYSTGILYAAYHYWDGHGVGFGWVNSPHKVAVINTGKGAMRVYIPAEIGMAERKKYREAFGA